MGSLQIPLEKITVDWCRNYGLGLFDPISSTTICGG